MESVKDLLGRLISNLPLKKLSANQVFDLTADLLMVMFVLGALFADLGPYQQVLKPLMILYSLGFITWSAAVNR